jgi:hypothetical protein
MSVAKKAEEDGTDYVSEDEAEEEPIPYITKPMLMSAMSYARRSVTKADLEKYMKYKRDMERKLGMDEVDQAPVVGLDNMAAPVAAAAPGAPAAAPAARNFGGEDDEDDDIYD